MRKCEIEDCEYPVFGKKRCKKHYPKSNINKVTERGLAKKAEKKERTEKLDRKSTRLNSSHSQQSRMPSSA